MQLNLTLAIAAVFALSMGTVLPQDEGFCYDAEQYTTKFSDLGSRQDIIQALTETCDTPTGDHTYACNAAVSVHNYNTGGGGVYQDTGRTRKRMSFH